MSAKTKVKITVPFFHQEKERLVCDICPRFCKLKEGQIGLCRGRQNLKGVLYALNYGEVASIALDPIEKKPLYHFYPGKLILSAGPNSCNFKCKFCQNYQISQEESPTRYISPQELVNLAYQHGSMGLSYTYTEPLMWYEFLLDCGAEFKQRGLPNILVTNGYINPKPLEKLLPLIDAMNIDLKSLEERFYQHLCGGVHLKPVLDTITTAYRAGVHIELTQLLIPGENDSEEQIERTVSWVKDLGKDIPLHFSRYFPRYKFTVPSTEQRTLENAYRIAKQELEWVYVGNINLEVGNHSNCPDCGAKLVERWGYKVKIMHLSGNRCGKCGKTLYFRN